MNLKLTTVITDLTSLTGMQIIRAILTGERDPIELSRFRDPRCKSSTHGRKQQHAVTLSARLSLSGDAQ